MPMNPEVADLDAIFDGAADLPLRDRPWGRPLLVPSETLAKAPLVKNPSNRKPREDGKLPYTRISLLSSYVTDHSALTTWQQRSLTYGLGQREDLAALAAALPPILSNVRSKEAMSAAERKADELTNAALDEIAEEAMVFANRDYKANWGTAVHSFTDPGAHGQVPARMVADVESFGHGTAGFVFHATEMFVANDLYQCAGTFDHLVSIPWRPDLGRMVIDKKTGILHPEQVPVQLAAYARAVPYNVHTDQREDWPDGIAPNQKWGLVAHIPMGLGRTQIYLVDLEKGHQAALLAVAVRAWRGDKKAVEAVDFQAELRLHIANLLVGASSREEMLGIHKEYEAHWTDALTRLATQRLAEVAGDRLVALA